MADFTDRLWRDLVREHGDDLTRMHRSAPRRPRRRMLAAAAAGLAAAGTALVVALGTSGTPAFAVDRHPDGRVTVTIYRIAGIRGANARLEALGIRVRAVPFVPGCAQMHAAAAPLQRALEFARARRGAIMSVGIDPRRIRPGRVMVLAARARAASPAPLAREFKDGKVPDCLGTVRVPPPLGGPVVCHTADGKTVPPQDVPPAESGNSGSGGASGDGAAPRRGVFCQAPLADPGASGNSGSSGTTGDG
jgi:hypothetical protein